MCLSALGTLGDGDPSKGIIYRGQPVSAGLWEACHVMDAAVSVDGLLSGRYER